MKSFKEYYQLKEGWNEIARSAKDKATRAAQWTKDVAAPALKKGGQSAVRGAKRFNTFANPYAKGNIIGRTADNITSFTKRMQGDTTADTAAFDKFRRKIAKIYTAKDEAPAGPGLPPENVINSEVASILNHTDLAPPRGGGRVDAFGNVTYSVPYTAWKDTVDQGQLFDLVNYNNPKGTGVYKDAHHLANIVLDQMSSFLSGGKYSYKDAERIIYGVPGSGTGMFNPEAIAVLDKYGMLYRQ